MNIYFSLIDLKTNTFYQTKFESCEQYAVKVALIDNFVALRAGM